MGYKIKVINGTRFIDTEVPFHPYQPVYYAYKKRKKWVLRKGIITGIWATNIVGVTLDNGWHIAEDEFKRLFKYDDLDKAKDFCVKQSLREKVKVYGE